MQWCKRRSSISEGFVIQRAWWKLLPTFFVGETTTGAFSTSQHARRLRRLWARALTCDVEEEWEGVGVGGGIYGDPSEEEEELQLELKWILL